MIFCPLTADTFANFGTLLDVPAQPGRTARLMLPANSRPHALPSMTLIHLGAEPASRSIAQIERHRDGGQAFVHLGGGGLLVVVIPALPDGRPNLADAIGFTTRPGQGFCYHPDIWHAGVSALAAPAQVASLLCVDGTAADVELLTLASPLLLTLP